MNRLAVLAFGGAGVLMLAACGPGGFATSPANSPVAGTEPGLSTYLCPGVTSDTLLQWRDSDGSLSGTYESAQLSGQAPQEQVSSDSGELSGSLDGTAITLNIGVSQPLYGTLSGSRLTLNVPRSDGTLQADTCSQASLNDWNKTVVSLNSQASGENNPANQQAAQQQLASAVSSLESDSMTLNNDTSLSGALTKMKHDYGQEQSAWQTVQSASCQNVSYDAGAVSYDAGAVNFDLGTLNYDVTSLRNRDIQAVKYDLSNVSLDLSGLQNLGMTPDTDSSSAVAAGNRALTSAANAISWADGQGSTINNEAKQLATTAQNYASAHSC